MWFIYSDQINSVHCSQKLNRGTFFIFPKIYCAIFFCLNLFFISKRLSVTLLTFLLCFRMWHLQKFQSTFYLGFPFFFTCGDIVMRRLFTLEFWRRRVFLFVKRPGNHRSLGKFWFSWNLYRWNNFAKLFRYCWRQMRLLNLGSLFNFWFI